MGVICRITHTLLFIIIVAGCGSNEPNPDVVAQVESVEITIDDLLRFRADTPAVLRSEKEGVGELREYLDSMIDMELMLTKARSMEIDQDPDFQRKLDREIRQKVVFEFSVREIKAKSDVPYEELRAQFEKSKWNRMLLLAHIRTATDKDAQKALRDLNAGDLFDEVAVEHSILDDTAQQGGLINFWYGRDNLERLGLPFEVADELFEKEVGAVAGPYQISGYSEIFKILKEKPAPTSYIMAFSQTTLVRAFVAQRQKTIDELKLEYQVRLDEAGIKRFARWVTEANDEPFVLSDEQAMSALCHMSNGQIEARDLYELFQKDGVFQPSELDSTRIAYAVENQLLPDALFYRRAVELGLDRDSTLVAWSKAKKRALLIEAVQDREVTAHMDLSESALKRYYKDHIDRFMLQEEVQIVEILTEQQQEAQALLDRVRNGENMGDLAVRYSNRANAKKDAGVLHIHPRDRKRFGTLFDAVKSSEIGTLQGPIEITTEASEEKKYSIFQVIDKLPVRPQEFAAAQRKIRYWLHKEEEARLIGELFKNLREQYSTQVVVFEDRLQNVNVTSGS